MSFPRYPKYKDSGVEWLGEVPEHWMLMRIRTAATIAGGGTPSREKPEYWNGEIPWVSPKDMKFEQISDSEERITELGVNSSSTSIQPIGCVLIVIRSGILQHTIPVGINSAPVAINQDLKSFRFVKNTCVPRFFLRWVQGLNDSLLLEWMNEGATVESFDMRRVENTTLPLPRLAEQTAIIAFLDRETAKIDGLVAEQRRLIELLKEKRQAVISHAVTKGLNPHAPMKPSGIEWLGDVPEHWTVASLRYFATFCTGSTPDRNNPKLWEGGIPWVKTGEINYTVITETEETISQDGLNLSSCSIAPTGTLLMALYGQGVTRGRVAMLGIPAAFNQACAANSVDDRISNEFLHAFFVFAYSFIRDVGNETTQMNMNIEVVRRVRVVVPPIREQLEIAVHVKSEGCRFDELTAEALRAIDLLQERRTALISAAVTGKIDVRRLAETEAP